MTIHLRSIQIRQGDPTQFPFSVPVVRHLESLEFTQPITFFVGENGSGKSTLLEAIALAAGLPTVGATESAADATLAALRSLADAIQWSWTKRTRKGFFMRAEDFFGYAKRMAAEQAELRSQIDEPGTRFGSDLARQLAKLPARNELAAIEGRYGAGLDAQSHGESFLRLFRARFVPDGLYLLDEPEAPLSPMRQLALLALFRQMLAQRAQFIIATHSPILLAYPGAQILSFDAGRIRPVDYESLEHVNITRDFLNNPQAFLHHLFTDDEL